MLQGNKIVKWGIPGWILIIWLLINFMIANQEFAIDILKGDIFKSLSLSVVFAGFGVPLGYLLHEVYFSLFWTLKKIETKEITDLVNSFPFPDKWAEMNDKSKYFYVEYIWDKLLYEQPEDIRSDIRALFIYRLSLIHSLGTLLVSMILTITISILWNYYLGYSFYTFIVLVMQVSVTFLISKNYIYHSKNLIHYQGFTINDMILSSKSQKSKFN